MKFNYVRVESALSLKVPSVKFIVTMYCLTVHFMTVKNVNEGC